MKKLILIVAALVAAVAASAQTPLPNDPAVKKGQLENGMTYYIRHNDKPAGRAEFYLATNVGAIQETPDQDGLAHFLEHMCFNGTKNLPGKQMLEYLQKIGASFGRNINAATGIEQTTYMLNNMPVTREGIIDTCLLVMHDYSHFVTCDPEEIDKERGVIIEEKRTRNSASWRMFEKSLPYLYGGSKYETCTLIGSQENLETFKPESLWNFYQTWYRPDLQALIVVGDIDVDQIEAKIKTLFSDIPAVENPTPKAVNKIPDNEEPIVAILTDPENASEGFEIYWKGEAMPEQLNNTDVGMMMGIIKSYIYYVMAERLGDISADPAAPFNSASLYIYDICETCESVCGNVNSKGGKENSLNALRAFYTEVEKMKRFGFTDDEVERAKAKVLNIYEKAAEGADTRENADFVQDLINNFFDNYSYMEPATEYEVAKAICGQLSAPLLNQMLGQLIPANNLVVLYQGIEKEGAEYPTKEEILNVIAEVQASDIQANETAAANEPLLDPATLKGSKVKSETKGIYGSTVWVLKNGVKVVVLPTEYKKNEVMMELAIDGGKSLLATEDLKALEDNIVTLFTMNRGVSKFPRTQLNKMLAGKTVYVNASIEHFRHGISASCTPKDLETAFQLMYLNFVEPRFDENEFNVGIEQIRAVLPNIINQPDFIFQNEMTKTVYGNNPREIILDEALLDEVSVKDYEKAYRQLFKDAAGATLFITGNVDLATLKPMVEKYIGSLPKGKKATTYVAENVPLQVNGKVENKFEVKMEAPKNTEYLSVKADIPYSVKTSVVYEAAAYILNMIYTDTLREEEGGTYGASAWCRVRKVPAENVVMNVYFDTNPQQVDRLTELALEGMTQLAEQGPTEEFFTRTVENFKKNIPEKRIDNSYWHNNTQLYTRYGIDYDKEYEEAVNNLTAADIQAAMKALLAQNNFIEIRMCPKAE
ncbi:MAG: M16 family metallopeptidase [Candidatus Cryptobacteroides sp.]